MEHIQKTMPLESGTRVNMAERCLAPIGQVATAPRRIGFADLWGCITVNVQAVWRQNRQFECNSGIFGCRDNPMQLSRCCWVKNSGQ